MNFSNVNEWTIPEGSVIKVTDSLGSVIWEKSTPEGYFYIEDLSGQSNTVYFKQHNNTTSTDAPYIRLYKSTDQKTWSYVGQTGRSNISATIPANGKLYFKSVTDSWCDQQYSGNYFNFIEISGNCNVGGNIMSLLYGDNFTGSVFTAQNEYAFYSLFANNSTIISAQNLEFPSNTVIQCYQYMFTGCTSLAEAPALPATTLANYCYDFMFYRCRALTTAPALPATTLANGCYRDMFAGCTSLTAAPELPVTTLADSCYRGMFSGCTSLTEAPALPATTLVAHCYSSMFDGCTSLNKVTTYANDISATYCLNNWLSNVAPQGNFFNLGGATYTTDSPSGIPAGWSEWTSLPDYFYVENTTNSPLTLTVQKNTATAPSIEVFKSNNQLDWTSMGTTDTTGITANIPANSKLYLKATTNSWNNSTNSDKIKVNGNYNIGGNIMSLLYGDNYMNQTSINSEDALEHLFSNETNLVNAGNLKLPATTLSNGCYAFMFYGCTALTTAPATLPATTLTQNCYYGMFQGCTSLTQAPELSATTLAQQCCYTMFQGCTSLTTAPALPATTLANYCYLAMFKGCTSLTETPVLPATTLTEGCCWQMFSGCTNLNKVVTYAQDISASYCLGGWLENVAAQGNFFNLGGATYTSGEDGIPIGWTEHKTL